MEPKNGGLEDDVHFQRGDVHVSVQGRKHTSFFLLYPDGWRFIASVSLGSFDV